MIYWVSMHILICHDLPSWKSWQGRILRKEGLALRNWFFMSQSAVSIVRSRWTFLDRCKTQEMDRESQPDNVQDNFHHCKGWQYWSGCWLISTELRFDQYFSTVYRPYSNHHSFILHLTILTLDNEMKLCLRESFPICMPSGYSAEVLLAVCQPAIPPNSVGWKIGTSEGFPDEINVRLDQEEACSPMRHSSQENWLSRALMVLRSGSTITETHLDRIPNWWLVRLFVVEKLMG